jgi:hypothetical protein
MKLLYLPLIHGERYNCWGDVYWSKLEGEEKENWRGLLEVAGMNIGSNSLHGNLLKTAVFLFLVLFIN